MSEPEFFSWEYRPAIIRDDGAWFKPLAGGAWREADAAEIIDSGRPVPAERFAELFPEAASTMLA